jgi:thioredoxin 1
MGKPIEVTDQSFDELVINSEKLILVDFWAEWCGPCKRIAPALEEIANELEGQLVIGKLDVDANPDTSGAYGVLSIPTLLLFKDGEPVDRIVGAYPKAQLLSRLQPHLDAVEAQ